MEMLEARRAEEKRNASESVENRRIRPVVRDPPTSTFDVIGETRSTLLAPARQVETRQVRSRIGVIIRNTK